MTGIPVLAAPAIDPGSDRIELTLPEGLTIAEIVDAALPGASAEDRARARVSLVGPGGSAMILAERWRSVRPRPGIRVVIRLVPGKGALRAVLSIVISIAAVALGAIWGPTVAGWFGVSTQVGTAIAGLGVSLVGTLIANALVPPPSANSERTANRYSISGWANRLEPDGAVPVVLGEIRYAPPFAARSYTEIVGDQQYVRALFTFGEGSLALTDFRLGDTSLSEYDEVEIEVRQGLADDQPVTIYPRQLVEEAIGVELTRPLPRDDLGEVIDGEPAEESPVVRTTGADASGASIILAWPGGLVRINDDGDRRPHSVTVRIEHRRADAEEWLLVEELTITARQTEAMYRQHSWSFPARGRWQVRLTMMTDETERTSLQQRTVWAALQSIRPEYPLAYPHPLALVALRIRATHQLSGQLDNFSGLAARICPDWDNETESWITRPTSNPASLYRYVLQCSASPKPVPDAEIDLELLADWHAFCAAKGLHYNRVLDQAGMTLREALTEVAAAGRATPRHDGTRWGVVIDRPQELIVDHLSPRNSWGFSVSRTYTARPHAWIVKFQDAGLDFREAQRVIRRPGYEGDITLTETLVLPGLTDPAVVWREGVRRFYEAEYRPDVFQATQAGSVRVATRGDAIMLNHDVLSRAQWAGRVRSVTGNLVELDEAVTMVEDQSYALRMRVFADEDDTIGTSEIRAVQTVPGETRVLVLTGMGASPTAGDIVHFGIAGADSHAVIVTGIEVTADQCQIVRSVAAAPEIDALTDAAEIPPWSSRVGAEIDENLLQPSAPRITSVSSGVAGAGEAGLITYLIEPGAGATATAFYRVSHRLGTSGDWTVVIVPVAAGGGEIAGYDNGDTVQIQATAVSYADIESAATATITLVVGAGDAAIPAALDGEAVTVTALLGGALIQVATGEDGATTQLQVYRSTSPVLDRETDAVGEPVAVAPLQSYSIALGDTTRATLIAGGTMDAPEAWSADAGWTIAGGVATHSPGTADAIGQALVATSGRWYRIAYTVSGRTAGSVTPRLTGGSDRPGTTVSANGDHGDRIQAVSGNDHIEFLASADFDGSIDDATVYLETTACLAQGTHFIWIEPQNTDSVPGPVSGPSSITII